MPNVAFGPLRVEYDDQVLEPRPWTLLQATWAAEVAPALPAGPMAELCAGVGQIGQAAAVLSGRHLVQVDADAHACDLARANAAANGLAPRVEVRCGDIGSMLRPGERFPLVLADPPYLPSDEVEEWPGDPTGAIDGGPDGLALQRRCLSAAADHLLEGGVVLLQLLGRHQLDRLKDHLEHHRFSVVEVREVDDRRAVALLGWLSER